MLTKVKFRDQLKEHVRKNFEGELGQLLPIRQSKLMTRFYLMEIQRVITPALVPSDEDDFDSCVIDGPNDCGVDFLSRAEGMVLIIQAKCRGYGVPEKTEDFTSFCEVLKRLHPATGSNYPKNQKLSEAISNIDWDNDIFELQYISLGRAVEGIRTRVEEGPTLDDPALAPLEDRCDLTFSDESDLNVKLREALSSGEMIAQPITLHFLPDDVGKHWLKLEGARKRAVYVGFINGAEIAEVYQPHRFRLFAMNIRDWVGDTTTNKVIVATAEERPDDFLFFNNGIAAVATSVEEQEEDGTLLCRNFSIINGAQTVRSLYKARSRNRVPVKGTTVMMRISTFSMGKEADFLEDVTKYNNTQNKVAVSDFRSNDPVQRDIASRFAKLKRGAKSFWYKNKRSREPLDRIPIEMEEFAKTIHAFRYGPHDMWGGTARLFDTGKDGRYSSVFGDGEEVWAKVPEQDFQVLSGIWFVCESIRQIWKEEKDRRSKDNDSGSALERRYMVYWSVGEFLRMIYDFKKASLDSDLRKLANPRWTEKDGAERSAIRELTGLAFIGLIKAYETASRQENFRHRNWFRDKGYMDGIKSELRFIRDIRKAALPTLAGN